MHSLLVLTLMAVASAVQVRVTDLQQRELTGDVQAWNERHVQLANPDGQTEISLDSILRVDAIAKPKSEALPPGEVLLTDGGRLAMTGFTSTNSECSIAGSPAASAQPRGFQAPLASVRAVRMMPLDASVPTLQKDWRDLLASDPAGDLIVIRKPGAANLNFVEGTLGDVTDQAVEFDLDGEVIGVNRAKVFGIIYFRREDNGAKPPEAVVAGPGFRLPIKSASLEGEQLQVQSPSLGAVALPMSAVAAVDYSLARVQYLSDLDPVQDDWNPPNSSNVAPLMGHIALDRGFYEAELTLAYPAESLSADEASSSGLDGIRTFAKGLAIRGGTEAGYRVPRDFTTFRAIVGIDPRSRDTAQVELTVLGDGKTLATETLRGDGAPVELECNMSGVRQLTLVVRSASPPWASGVGDILHLGGARFVK